MSYRKDHAIRQLEAVEMMTRKYTEYLTACKLGGDWTLNKFMNHLNATTKQSRETLETLIND